MTDFVFVLKERVPVGPCGLECLLTSAGWCPECLLISVGWCLALFFFPLTILRVFADETRNERKPVYV